MSNELYGYKIIKVERLAKGIYLAVCRSNLTGINSARIVSIPLENEKEAMVNKDCEKVIELITKAAYKSIVLNYDDSDKCETVLVEFSEEDHFKLQEWCKSLGISEYALFRAVNLFLCDPANEECIINHLKSFKTKDGSKVYGIDLDK